MFLLLFIDMFVFLFQEEENPSDDLIGAVTAEAKKQAAALTSELGGAEVNIEHA